VRAKDCEKRGSEGDAPRRGRRAAAPTKSRRLMGPKSSGELWEVGPGRQHAAPVAHVWTRVEGGETGMGRRPAFVLKTNGSVARAERGKKGGSAWARPHGGRRQRRGGPGTAVGQHSAGRRGLNSV
jgi:hypothetical protein